jgi:predicted nucleic acid-binding protein
LRRPKFKIKSEIVDQFLTAVSTAAVAVEPTTVIQAAKDPDDDKFLELRF